MKTGYKILIGLGAGAACFGLSMLSPFMLAPFLALAGFIAAQWGAYYMLPALVGSAAGVLLSTGTGAGSFAALAMYLLVPVVLFVYGRRAFPHRFAVLALAVILTLGFYLSVTLDSIIAGQPPYAAALAYWDESVAAPFGEIFAGLDGYSESAELLSAARDAIPDVLMPSSLAMGEALALALVLIYRLISRLFRVTPAPMASFKDWRLPHTVLIGCAVLALVIPFVWIFRFDRAAAITVSLLIIIFSMLALQGLAYLMFVLSAAGAPVGLRILSCVLPALLFPYSLILLGYFGVKEQIKNRRRMMREYVNAMKEMSEAQKRSDEINKYGYSRGDEGGDGSDDDSPKEDGK